MTSDSPPLKTGWEIFAETLVGLVSALAWPALIVFAILFFGQPIKNLISRIKSASIAGNTLDFTEELQHVSTVIKRNTSELKEETAADAEAKPEEEVEGESGGGRMSSDKMNALFELGSISPASAVMEAFKYVDYEWEALLEAKGIGKNHLPRGRYKNFHDAINLPASVIRSFDQLRMLRNKAAHEIEHNISAIDASNYIISAFQLAELLRAARDKLDTDPPPYPPDGS